MGRESRRREWEGRAEPEGCSLCISSRHFVHTHERATRRQGRRPASASTFPRLRCRAAGDATFSNVQHEETSATPANGREAVETSGAHHSPRLKGAPTATTVGQLSLGLAGEVCGVDRGTRLLCPLATDVEATRAQRQESVGAGESSVGPTRWTAPSSTATAHRSEPPRSARPPGPSLVGGRAWWLAAEDEGGPSRRPMPMIHDCLAMRGVAPDATQSTL